MSPARFRLGAPPVAAFLLAGALALPLAAGPAAAPQPGQAAPAFAATDSNGNPVSLADFRGETVVLEWSNHDCPYVKKHYETGNMQSTQKQATDAGAVWLTVVSSAPGKQGHVDGGAANDLTRKRDAHPSAVLLDPDGAIGRAYDAKTTPHMFVIDGAGTLVYMGAIDDKPTADHGDVKGATNYVLAALSSVAANQPVAPAVTKPYGCSVKYD